MFLLVPAHPGCPGHNPESCKMVVVVVVVVVVVAAAAAAVGKWPFIYLFLIPQ